jgi:hypothetical protein
VSSLTIVIVPTEPDLQSIFRWTLRVRDFDCLLSGTPRSPHVQYLEGYSYLKTYLPAMINRQVGQAMETGAKSLEVHLTRFCRADSDKGGPSSDSTVDMESCQL